MITWFDRFKGEPVTRLSEQIVPSRYVVQTECAFNNHTHLFHGDIIVNDGTGKYHIDSLIGTFTHDEAKSNIEPERNIIESSLLSYQESKKLGKKTSFLIPEKLLSRFELTKFEKLLIDVLKKGHLQEIARRPRMELIYEEHLVPVSRAKKLAGSANAHLASHSECWQTRTITGVIPKHILALESEDQLNIYENRVYVKLLKYIEQYLANRILEVKKLEEIFQQAMNFQNAEDIYFELRESIFSLWGEGFLHDELADNAALNGLTTIELLTKMQRAVRTLKQSDLYLKLTNNIHVPLKLNMTNVLSHDQHYRHVARLWDSWLDTQQNNILDPKETFKRNKQLSSSYSLYCADLVRRAMKEMRFTEVSSNVFERNGTSQVQFEMTCNEEIVLKTDEMHLVLIPCFTDHLGEEGMEAAKHNHRVVLSLCKNSDVRNNNLFISPTHFYSLEQIIALISSWLVTNTYQALEFKLSKIPSTLLEQLSNLNRDEQWHIEESSLVIRKPSSFVVPDLRAFKESHTTDTSLVQAIEMLSNGVERYENLLYCPCCGSKVAAEQWIVRDNQCFAIRNSSCLHQWEVNMQQDSKKTLSIRPTKYKVGLSEGRFEQFGRFLVTHEV